MSVSYILYFFHKNKGRKALKDENSTQCMGKLFQYGIDKNKFKYNND